MEFSRLAVSVKVWISTVPATALVTALATARSFTRSCELSFEALSLFLAQYTCT
jgi:hypothetical protein